MKGRIFATIEEIAENRQAHQNTSNLCIVKKMKNEKWLTVSTCVFCEPVYQHKKSRIECTKSVKFKIHLIFEHTSYV